LQGGLAPLAITSSQLRKRPLQLFGVVGEHLRSNDYFIMLKNSFGIFGILKTHSVFMTSVQPLNFFEG